MASIRKPSRSKAGKESAPRRGDPINQSPYAQALVDLARHASGPSVADWAAEEARKLVHEQQQWLRGQAGPSVADLAAEEARRIVREQQRQRRQWQREHKAVLNSPQFKARNALRARLIEAKADPVISQSETSVDLLDMFIKLIDLTWGTKTDAADVIRPLSKHFDGERSKTAARIRAEKLAAERGDEAMFAFLDQHADKKPPERRRLLRERYFPDFSPEHQPWEETNKVYRRWRDSKKRKKE